MKLKFNPFTSKFDFVSSKATEISIVDSGSYFTGIEVEAALQELGLFKSTTISATYLKLDSSNQASWTPTTVLVPNLNAQLWEGNDIDSKVAQGDLPYASATGMVTVLPKSTSTGFYLSNGGTNNNPIWDAVRMTQLLVRNETGTTIAAGKAVYMTGFNNYPLVDLADNTDNAKHIVLGIVISAIVNQANGYIATTGQFTANTNGYTAVGQLLYLGTSGTLTETQPTSGVVLPIGRVTVKDTVGKILLIHDAAPDYLSAASATDIYVRMGDSVGANKINFKDYTDAVVGSINSDGLATFTNFVSTVATGTQPYAATSTTVNTNLNADLLDGLHDTAFPILAPTTDARNVIQPTDAAVKALVLKGAASQSDNLLEIQNSAGGVLAFINSNGGATFNESGADTDFRVEGDTNVNMIFVDASVDALGFGTTAPTTGGFANFSKTFTNTVNVSGGLYTIQGVASLNPAGASDATVYGVKCFASANGAQVLSGGSVGLFGQVQNFHTNSLATSYAMNFSASNNSTGTITALFGISVGVASAANAGTITNAYANNCAITAGNNSTISIARGINLAFGHGTGTSIITTAYALYINTYASNAGTSNHGIYIGNISGATSNYAIQTNAGNIVFNDGGDANTDFRVEGDTNANMLLVDASANAILFGTATQVTSAGITLGLDIGITDAKNVILGTTTGTKIGTATSQKLAFFNSTPIVQPANTTDIKDALINLGLLASGGATPINLDGGAITAGDSNTLGSTTITDAKDITFGTTTGTKIGTATTQKIGLWNVTPIVQPAAANQAALTNSTGGSYDGTLVPATDGASINNNFTDVYTLLTEIRTALVNSGIMKGSA